MPTPKKSQPPSIPPPTTQEEFLESLNNNPAFVSRVLLHIYGQQTPPERALEKSLCRNRVGFNIVDASLLSPYARLARERRLTKKELLAVRPRLRKYAVQMMRTSNGGS
jgi:hypothetical protein